MKTKKWIKASMLLMVATLFVACANEEIAQDKKKENGTEAPKGGVVFATNDTKISAKRRFIDEDEFAGAKTRTNIKHTPGNGADAYWTSDDFIWVKNKYGAWNKSTAITLHDGGASAEFTLPGSKADYTDGCEVRYTGDPSSFSATPSAVNVAFPWNQSRTAPNDFSKAGEWGDCGSGVARNTGNPDKFNFTLSHKSSYLCFLPRCENVALAPNVRLKSIKITAILGFVAVKFAGLFSFDGENIITNTPAFNNKITVTLPDLPLYTNARQADNATYLAVLPGTYDLKIVYTIKDPTTNVEMVISQMLTNVTLNKGEINDITADLAPFSTHGNFYMWGAKNPYWYGYEQYQPQVNDASDPHWPNPADPSVNMNDRDYDHGATGTAANPVRYDAKADAFSGMQGLPNANELCWYVEKGDPRYATGPYEENGHLVSSNGLWLRKKSTIVAYLKTIGYPSTLTWDEMKEGYKAYSYSTPIDARLIPQSPYAYASPGAPTNPEDYFFLPARGCYRSGKLYYRGISGWYWSSNADPSNGKNGLNLVFGDSGGNPFARMYSMSECSEGDWVQPFE